MSSAAVGGAAQLEVMEIWKEVAGGGAGKVRANSGAASPFSVLACPLAGPCEGAVMASQGKAGLFPKTAKLGDFRVHRAWGGMGMERGMTAKPKPSRQQRLGWERWGEAVEGRAAGSCSLRG